MATDVESFNNSNYRGCRTSALESVKRCPFSVQKVYRDKCKGYIDNTALRGSAVHDCLEDYGNHCLQNKTATDFEYWDSIVFKYAASVPSEVYQETMDILEDAKEFVNFSYLINSQFPKIEERFYLNEKLEIIDPCDNAYFSSAIDTYAINDTEADVSDYKTSRKIYNNTVLKTKLQKDYYPLLIFKKYPNVEVIRFYFDFIRYGKVTDPITVTRTDDYDRLEKKLKNDIEYYYEIVNDKKDREARPSSFCTLCEVRGLCPSVRNAIHEDAFIIDQDSAINAARLMKALAIKQKQIKNNLEEYLNKHGNISISDLEGYGIIPGTKESVDDIFHLVEELKEKKVAPGKIFDSLKLSKGAYLKLLKGTDIDISKYLKSSPSTKTGFFDLENDDEEDSSSGED